MEEKKENTGIGIFKHTNTQQTTKYHQNDFGDEDYEEETIIFNEFVSEETDEEDD